MDIINISLEKHPLFKVFISHGAVLLIKMCCMSILTVVTYYASSKETTQQEVIQIKSGKDNEVREKIVMVYPLVERVRRCHRNDLEIILPFILLGVLYVSCDPDIWVATNLFRLFTLSRFTHTAVYLFGVPQPSRVIIYYTGFLVNVCIAFSIFRHAVF